MSKDPPSGELVIRNDTDRKLTVTLRPEIAHQVIEREPRGPYELGPGREQVVRISLSTKKTNPTGEIVLIGGGTVLRVPVVVNPVKASVKSWELTNFLGWPFGFDRPRRSLPIEGTNPSCSGGTATLSSGSRTATVRWECNRGAVRLHPNVPSWFYGAKYTGKLQVGASDPIDLTVRQTWAVWIVGLLLGAGLAFGYWAARFVGSGRTESRLRVAILRALDKASGPGQFGSVAALKYRQHFDGLTPRPEAADYDLASLATGEATRLQAELDKLVDDHRLDIEKSDELKPLKEEITKFTTFIDEWPATGAKIAEFARTLSSDGRAESAALKERWIPSMDKKVLAKADLTYSEAQGLGAMADTATKALLKWKSDSTPNVLQKARNNLAPFPKGPEKDVLKNDLDQIESSVRTAETPAALLALAIEAAQKLVLIQVKSPAAAPASGRSAPAVTKADESTGAPPTPPYDPAADANRIESQRESHERLLAVAFGCAAMLGGLETMYLGKEFGGIADAAKLLAFGMVAGAVIDSLNKTLAWIGERASIGDVHRG